MRWTLCLLPLAHLLLALACTGGSGSPATSPDSEHVEAEPSTTAPLEKLADGEPASPLPVEADDARLGADRAPVTLVAFLDYECPFCAEAFANLMKLRDRYAGDQLRIVVKHLPLDIHPRSLPAAVAGQAVRLAAGSEAFFEFSRLAFEGQAELDYVKLAKWAEEAGVSRSLYNELVTDEDTVRRVARDLMLAKSVGVEGTPAFFVNGRALQGAHPPEAFDQVIDEELAHMRASKESWEKAYLGRLQENMSVTLVEALLSRDPHNYRVPVDDSPVVGPAEAPVTMVVFTDFECPFCKRAHPTVEALRQRFPNALRVVFKHLPLSFHDLARPAARLSVQIHDKKGAQAFFSAVDELFEASPQLSPEHLNEIGERHGLTAQEIQEALRGSAELESRIQRDETLAEDVLARGTPHFFINGKRLTGARPLEHFVAIIEAEKQRAEKLIAEGVAPENLYSVLQKDARQPGAPKKADRTLPVERRPTLGDANAPVTIHVFSDFQCPFCKKAESVLEELRSRYPGKLRFVWHDLPLPFHDRALPAALAAHEALRQGGNETFWRMHDALFSVDSANTALSQEQILDHTKRLGLNVEKMKHALTTEKLPPRMKEDEELAKSLGIDGTPAFVVGGYVISGARPVEHFQRVVDLVLRERAGGGQR